MPSNFHVTKPPFIEDRETHDVNQEDYRRLPDCLTESLNALEKDALFNDMKGENLVVCLKAIRISMSDEMDLLAEQVKMLSVSGEIAFSSSTLKRLMEQSVNDPESSRNQAYSVVILFQSSKQFDDYVEGKWNFPWKHRLSIAVGIARGFAYIYRSSKKEIVIPHGNIKPSNILLSEKGEPLISEYGYCKFLDPNKSCLYKDNVYTAPEKKLTEETDVYSFRVILLKLLTGKVVEKTRLDLVKWMKSIVREEWTGEVFDSEVANFEMYAFPLLNVALKCVDRLPEERPTMVEVLEIIDEVVNAQEDISPSSMTSFESTPCSMKHMYVI
ncbi:probable inactive receptor kinase At3g08680 [Solanum dulcamara]|uniref:probable inactive receptor kinase At3g08680 n=1 Tax=Solanum dulcamara TaxID=45834 RepID=UPI002484F9F4|nr:probable inactive receptor kinase At3g08680 [Solanum dulcamara]